MAAEQRQTVYYLGGEADAVEKARPILEPIASALLHIGPLGSASTLKLAMNMNIAGIAQSLCESLAFCRAAGIPDEVYFSAQFSLKHMAKDLRLALKTAADLSISLEQTGHLKAIYDQGIAAGWSEDDFIGLIRLMENKHC